MSINDLRKNLKINFFISEKYHEGSFKVCAETLEQAQEIAKTVVKGCIVYTDGGKLLEGMVAKCITPQIISKNINSI